MTRLINDLENYKDVLQKTETRLGKKIKDLSTQLTAKVSYNVWIIRINYSFVGFLTISSIIIQSSELEAMRESMKKYEDYEEIKRELEIMKVGAYDCSLRMH